MTIHLPQYSTPNLYEQDFYLWIKNTAQLLRERRFDEVDIENLVEEIECMGRSERRELKSRSITLIEHLLKLIYWSSERDSARGWRSTIIEQRNQIELVLGDNPSLKTFLIDVIFDCYQRARRNTSEKSQLPLETFPAEPPFTLDEILDYHYLPE